MNLEKKSKDLQTLDQKDSRSKILDFENAIKSVEGHLVGTKNDRWPLKHTFSEGIYVREIFIPAGDLIVGKIHKHEHPNFLLSGEVHVFTENLGEETIVGPSSIISLPGTKRSLYAVTDLVWVTVHCNPTNTRDIDELESMIAVDTYEEYDNFNEKVKNSLTYRVRKRLIKFLEV